MNSIPSQGRLALSRRAALAGLAALPVTGSIPARAAPPRALLLKNADHILTMAPADAPLSASDILIRDGAIAAIGSDMEASDADIIDMRGHIVLPGFVDTHWHMWNTAARGMASTKKGGFTPTMAALSSNFSPADAPIGVELALAEAVNAGITTVHNWAHNTRSPAHAEAELYTMVRSGVRGRFAYGYAQDADPLMPMDIAHLTTLSATPPLELVSMGICARGPDRSDAAVWRKEWDGARRLGLPISTHVASDPKAAAMKGITSLAARDGLGADVQLVHLTAASRADMELVAQAGSPVSISPWTELEVGYGLPPIADMITAGLLVGLSVDNMVLAGFADMTPVMRLASDLARGQARDQSVVTDATALQWATSDGARSLGLQGKIGVLRKGFRADIIAIRTDAINMLPANDPDAIVTHAARPENVSLVLIDGILHKREGQLVRADLLDLKARATRSIAALRATAAI